MSKIDHLNIGKYQGQTECSFQNEQIDSKPNRSILNITNNNKQVFDSISKSYDQLITHNYLNCYVNLSEDVISNNKRQTYKCHCKRKYVQRHKFQLHILKKHRLEEIEVGKTKAQINRKLKRNKRNMKCTEILREIRWIEIQRKQTILSKQLLQIVPRLTICNIIQSIKQILKYKMDYFSGKQHQFIIYQNIIVQIAKNYKSKHQSNAKIYLKLMSIQQCLGVLIQAIRMYLWKNKDDGSYVYKMAVISLELQKWINSNYQQQLVNISQINGQYYEHNFNQLHNDQDFQESNDKQPTNQQYKKQEQVEENKQYCNWNNIYYLPSLINKFSRLRNQLEKYLWNQLSKWVNSLIE